MVPLLVVATTATTGSVVTHSSNEHPVEGQHRHRRRLNSIPIAVLARDLTGSIQDLTYKLPLQIGTPPFAIELRVDTGSTETFVPTSTLCPKCAADSGTTIGNSAITLVWNPFECSASSSCATIACDSANCTGGACDAQCLGNVGLGGDEATCDEDADDLFTSSDGDVLLSNTGQDQPCCAAADASSCGFSSSYADGSVVAGALASDVVRVSSHVAIDAWEFGELLMRRRFIMSVVVACLLCGIVFVVCVCLCICVSVCARAWWLVVVQRTQ